MLLPPIFKRALFSIFLKTNQVMPVWWTQTLSDAMGKARTPEFKLLFLRFPVPPGLLSVTDDCLQHYLFWILSFPVAVIYTGFPGMV